MQLSKRERKGYGLCSSKRFNHGLTPMDTDKAPLFIMESRLSHLRMHRDHELTSCPGSAGVSPACWLVPKDAQRRRDASAPRVGFMEIITLKNAQPNSRKRFILPR